MSVSSDDHRAVVSVAANPRPIRFGLKSIFVGTAIVAALAAGASAAGLAGFAVAAITVLVLSWAWARGARRQRLADFLARCCAYVAIPCLLVGLIPSSGSHSGGRRTTCLNNLKQLGMALEMYERQHRQLPAAYTVDRADKPLMSWRTSILPLIEEGRIFVSYRQDEAWDSATNKPLSQIPLEIFHCPSDPGPWLASGKSNSNTSYVAIIGPGTAWQPGRGIKFSEIKDNLSDTILLVELANSGIAWAEPRDLDLNNLPPGITPQNLLQSLSAHPGCFNALFADGHVESIPSTIPWSDFMALLTIAGGEKIDRSKW